MTATIIFPTDEMFAEAARILCCGGLVLFPTETVYGLGADAKNPQAVERIFRAKKRPHSNPIIVHIHRVEQLSDIALEIPPAALILAERFWPGPLTLVLRKRDVIPDIVTAGLPQVAVRIPSHPIALRLLAESGLCIAAPSANEFGSISPTRLTHVSARIRQLADYELNGGPCTVGIESTVVSLCENQPLLLRHGGISHEELEQAIGPVRLLTQSSPRRTGSPGLTPRHYAPRTPMLLVEPGSPLPASGRFGVLRLSPEMPAQGATVVETLSESGDLREAAANLFDALHRLDKANLDLIIAYTVPERGLGRGIMDRLRRGTQR